MIAKKQPYKIISYPYRRNVGKIIRNPYHEEKEGEEIATKILSSMGGDVKFLPELHIPNIKNPDCEWRKIIWEIKTLYGNSRDTTIEAIHKGAKQSHNIIVNTYLTKRDINRIAIDICFYFKTDPASYQVKQILILGKNEYSLIKRNMLI